MMLKGSGGGGIGRDVIFSLKAVADPAAKQVFQTFAAEMTKAQKAMLDAAKPLVRKAAEERKKSEQEATLDVSKTHRAAELADLKFRRDLQKKRLDEEQRAEKAHADWKSKVYRDAELADFRFRQNLYKQQLKDEERAKVKAAQDAARTDREQIRMSNRERILGVKRDRAMGHAWDSVLGGAGNIARGVAYTGLIGEQNTQNVLDTLMAVEGGRSLYQGGKSLIGGIGTLATGGTATGGAAVAAGAPFAAAAAAIAGMTAAAVSFAGVVRNASKYGLGGGAEAGSYTDTVAGWSVKAGVGIERRLPAWLQSTMTRDMIASEKGVDGTQKTGEHEATMRAARTSILARLGAFQSRSISEQDLSGAREQLLSNYNTLRNVSAGGAAGSDVQQAYENARQSMERMKQLSVETARNQMEGSRDQLENLRHSHTMAKQMADEAKRNYQSDIMKAATATPEEANRIREIARKKKSGEGLTRTELDYAAQFNEFKPLVESEAERRAGELGLSDFFATGRGKYKETEYEESQLKEQISKIDLEVKQKHEFVLKIEKGEFTDEAMKQMQDAIKEIESRMNANLQQGIVNVVNNRSFK